MHRTKIVIAVIVAVLMVILGLQNTQVVDATMFFFTAQVSLSVLLLLSFGVGVVAGLLIALALSTRRKGTAVKT